MNRRAENFKGSIHAALACLSATFLAYNALRIAEDNDKRNWINVGVYLPLTIFELVNVKHHWSQVDD